MRGCPATEIGGDESRPIRYRFFFISKSSGSAGQSHALINDSPWLLDGEGSWHLLCVPKVRSAIFPVPMVIVPIPGQRNHSCKEFWKKGREVYVVIFDGEHLARTCPARE